MITVFEKLTEINDNFFIKGDELVYKLETEGQEDVFVGITADEYMKMIGENDGKYLHNLDDYYIRYIWRLLFEKAISKYQQARTQLMKKC